MCRTVGPPRLELRTTAPSIILLFSGSFLQVFYFWCVMLSAVFRPILHVQSSVGTDKLGNIAFNIADESHFIMNAILRSLSVNYSSVY